MAQEQNESFPFPVEPFSACEQVLRHYGSFFIISCIRYLNLHTERVLNDYGGYQPKGASFAELLLAVTGKRSVHYDEWLSEHQIPSLEDCNEMMAMLPEYIRRCTELTRESLPDAGKSILTIESLKEIFQLSELEKLILVTCVLIQYDELYTHAWRYVTGADSSELPTAGFLMDLYDFLIVDSSEGRNGYQFLYHLLKYGLITLKYRETWGEDTPPGMLYISVPRRILSFILGDTESFTPVACRWLANIDEDTVSLDDALDSTLQTHLQKSSVHLALLGYKGLGRSTAVGFVAKRMSIPVLELNMKEFCAIWQQTPEFVGNVLASIFREIHIQNGLLLIRYESVENDYQEWLNQHAYQFYEILSGDTQLKYGVLLDRQTVMSRRLFGELSEVQFPPPSREIQPKLWKKALSRMLPEEKANELSSMLSTGYCLSFSEMNFAIEQTLTRLSGESSRNILTAENISETLNKTRGHKLEGMASLRSTTLLLKDIVLSDDIRKTLNEILSYARYSEMVMEDWGFSKYNSSGAGLSVLLSGVPGTGKTLTALVLAHELRRALYVVDLSRVVDKYIGETEKKLSVIFDEAERSQAMLLFDEADSLFAKRTDVKSSNDRYANLEVNYLLQRLEAYRGVSILTTNFGGGLDEALARRIQFKVNFPMPDVNQRAELWKRLIPPRAPRTDDLDLLGIAGDFEMSGGHIKNAIFRACILAASTGEPLNNELLWDAAVHEYRSMGHIIRDDY